MAITKNNKELFEIIKERILINKDKYTEDKFDLDFEESFYPNCTFSGLKTINNGLDKTNVGYDEYESLEFYVEHENDGEDKSFVSVNYHNIPDGIIYEDNVIFDMNDYFEEFENKTINVDFDFFKVFYDRKVVKTGYEILDSDEKFIKLYNNVRNLCKDPYSLEFDESYHFDEDIYLKKENELLDAYEVFIEYMKELTKGVYRIEDLFEPSFKRDRSKIVFSKFTEKDLSCIRNNIFRPLLNKGAKFYTKGDYENSFPYNLAAALGGDEQAINNLGYSFMYGRSVEKNMDLAITCFSIASDKGCVESTYKLGTIYKYNTAIQNLEIAKEYFIKATEQLAYQELSFTEYPSLALSLAKEKIDGTTFEKDIFGAYLLLKLAYTGYKKNVEGGFAPHEKQYEETKSLLDDSIFALAKVNYRDNLEYSYLFKDSKMTLEEYTSSERITIGDKIVLLKDFNYRTQGEEVTELKAGTIFEVTKVLYHFYQVRFINEESPSFYYLTEDMVRKIQQ